MKGYHIIEVCKPGQDDLGQFLRDQKVRYTIRSATKIDADANLRHLVDKKGNTVFFIYTARIEDELALVINLKFPDVVVNTINEERVKA
jgi:hypothetical protein